MHGGDHNILHAVGKYVVVSAMNLQSSSAGNSFWSHASRRYIISAYVSRQNLLALRVIYQDAFAWHLGPHANHEQVYDHRDLRDC